MRSLNDVGGIPTEGNNLLIVADVRGVLHFRAFGGDGGMDLDTDETKLPGVAAQIEDLRKQLGALWPPHGLTQAEEQGVIDDVERIIAGGDQP